MWRVLKILACFPLLLPKSVLATSPCENNGCVDSASAYILVPLDMMEAKCAAIDPGMAPRYSAVVARFLQNEDANFVRELRASKHYAAAKEEVESKMGAVSSEEVSRACASFLREFRGATEQSIPTRSRAPVVFDREKVP